MDLWIHRSLDRNNIILPGSLVLLHCNQTLSALLMATIIIVVAIIIIVIIIIVNFDTIKILCKKTFGSDILY